MGETTTRDDFRKKVMEVLDGIFWKSFKSNSFGTICSILRVGGMTDANWDPFEESRRAFDDCNWMLAKALEEKSAECQRRIGLLMYCQAVEMTAPHEILANLLRCLKNERYRMNPFGHLGRRKKKELFSWILPSASAKIKEIKKLSAECHEEDLAFLFDSFFDERIRNSFSHSDYILTNEYFRYSKGGLPQQIIISELDQKISKCFDFYGPFMSLHEAWRKQLAKLPRYHKWPNFEVLELLSAAEEGLYGFSIHFSNGSKATYTRRVTGIDAVNLHFERGGTINFFCGLIDALEQIWKIDGKPVTDWESVNRVDNA